MNSLIRQSLLASIQTIRAVLLGMEAMLKTQHEEPRPHKLRNVLEADDEVEEIDLKKLGQQLGLVGNGGRDVED